MTRNGVTTFPRPAWQPEDHGHVWKARSWLSSLAAALVGLRNLPHPIEETPKNLCRCDRVVTASPGRSLGNSCSIHLSYGPGIRFSDAKRWDSGEAGRT